MDAGDVLAGRYRLVERLGEGGMSVVWRAHDEVLDRQVAVKVLSPRLVADQDSRQRIRAEAQAVAKLAHPNIAGVFDFGEHDDGGVRVPYIVMELLSGQTLAQRLDEGPLSVADVLRICSQVATALGEAHEHGLVHRDVKPANIMVTANNQTKVVDFGVAAVVGDLTDRDKVLFGTPAYVAPERLSGGAVVAATDIYGLGVLLYRMLAGHMPWSAESTTQMLVAHMYVEPDPLPPLTGLPPEVVEVCEACLAKEPADRPGAAEVAEILAESAGSLAGTVTPVRRYPIRSKPRRRASVLIVAAAVLVAVVSAGVVAAAALRPDRPGEGPASAGRGGVAVPGASVGVGATNGTGTASPGAPGATNTGGTTRGPGEPAGPGETDPTTAVPPTNAPTSPTSGGGGGTQNGGQQPVRSSQTSRGNTVTAECDGASGTLVNATPADGWSVTRVEPGPTTDKVVVKFTSSANEPFKMTFRVRCNNGVPRFNLSND